jgi:hypothetical protein
MTVEKVIEKVGKIDSKKQKEYEINKILNNIHIPQR